MFGFCVSALPPKPLKVNHVKSNPVSCEVCEYAMTYLDSVLEDHATEQEIVSALDTLCTKLPSSISGEVNRISI